MQLVTITSQGQISIPAAMRKKYGLKANSKAYVSDNNGHVAVHPVSDFLSLAGSLNKYAIKGKSIEEVMKIEKEAIGQAIVDDYKRSLKRQSIKNLPK